MVGSVLQQIRDCEACELHYLHYEAILLASFHLSKTHWFQIRAFVLLIVVVKQILEYFSSYCQNMVKNTCGKPTFACSFIVMCLS